MNQPEPKRRFFYDAEFIEYPSTIDLVSIAIVNEQGMSLYCVSSEFDALKADPWVAENVLAKLPPESERMTRGQIRSAVLDFLSPSKANKVELWGYYSAYDHVAFCWLFGPMVELPRGMPMYTRDLKQWCDRLGNPKLPPKPANEHDALADARWNLDAWRFLEDIGRSIELLATERRRQINNKGWDSEHDDEYVQGELAQAAACYAAPASIGRIDMSEPPGAWPWAPRWWRPSLDPVHNLTKAGALVLAEIDRYRRVRARVPQAANAKSGDGLRCEKCKDLLRRDHSRLRYACPCGATWLNDRDIKAGDPAPKTSND